MLRRDGRRENRDLEENSQARNATCTSNRHRVGLGLDGLPGRASAHRSGGGEDSRMPSHLRAGRDRLASPRPGMSNAPRAPGPEEPAHGEYLKRDDFYLQEPTLTPHPRS